MAFPMRYLLPVCQGTTVVVLLIINYVYSSCAFAKMTPGSFTDPVDSW